MQVGGAIARRVLEGELARRPGADAGDLRVGVELAVRGGAPHGRFQFLAPMGEEDAYGA